LEDVQIHCNSNAQGISGFSEASNFYSNDESEINILITDVQLGSADGFAQLSATNNNIVIEDIHPGLVMHELGHVLGLEHTYIGPGQEQFVSDCEDVWTEGFTWDSNGDGIEDTDVHRCFHNTAEVNGLDACDSDNFNPVHPCCDWRNQDNNLMAGSAWSGNPDYGAVTPCQLEKMLTNIGTNMCDYISSLGCALPTANIGLIPLDANKGGDCEFCFHFESSMNDDEYRIIFKQDDVSVYDSNWKEGPVGKYCLNVNTNSPLGNKNGIVAGAKYTVELHVSNDCGTGSDVVNVSIPISRGCSNRSFPMIVNPNPNPVTSLLNIEYTLEDEGRIRMKFFDPINMENKLEILDTSESIGTYNRSIDLSTYRNGVYFLMYEHNGITSFETILKQ